MKPLKILLGNNTLALLAGSETWTQTLAVQLKMMGHEVSCFSPTLGIISDQLEKEGINCYKDIQVGGPRPFSFILEENIEHQYDVIIANHNHIVDYLCLQFPKTPIISTIHGIIHEYEGKIAPEHPALNAGVNQFVSVSEEIQEKMKHDYNIESVIIRNFFDIKKFKNLRKPSQTPKQFLINTNYMDKNDPAIAVLREVAKHYGAKMGAVGMNFSQASDIIPAIEDADIVFGMGRSILEGVAAGRLGIVHGRWGTGGVVCDSMVNPLRHFNFSGRNSDGVFWTKEEFIEMIDRYYNPQTMEWGQNYINSDHNVVIAADAYVRLARELLGDIPSFQTGIGGVDPQARKFRLASKVSDPNSTSNVK